MNNKPRSQDKQTNVIVIKQHNLSKPQSANVAYSLRNTFKKENNVVNSKHSPSSLNSTKHHPKSCNVAQQQRNQSKQKQFINKNVIRCWNRPIVPNIIVSFKVYLRQ